MFQQEAESKKFFTDRFREIFRSEYLPIILLVGLNIIIGLLIVKDYGVSIDEPLSWRFGSEAIRNYLAMGEVVHVDFSHGGGFLIPARFGALIFNAIFPGWQEPHAWHFSYFLLFQLSIFLIYLLTRKFSGQWGATFAALLYSTQPLLWGHSFMNPKDTPFLALFLGALVFGIYFVDALEIKNGGAGTPTKPPKTVVSKRPGALQAIKITAALLMIVLVLGLILGREAIDSWLEAGITTLYQADPVSIPGKLFFLFARRSAEVPLTDYLGKAIQWYDRWIGQYGPLLIVLSLLNLFRVAVPNQYSVVKGFVGRISRRKYFWPTAILLGMCISARTFGIAALVLLVVYAVIKAPRKSVGTLLLVFFVSILIAFAFWPDLWGSPGETYLVYLRNVFGFEKWNGKLLFEGELYNKENYPSSYLPKLLALQLTEPALLFSLAGLGLAVKKVFRREYDWVLTTLLMGWLFGPILLAVVLRPVVYNSFRHFLWILPPVFIFSGIGFEFVIGKIKAGFWRGFLAVAVLLPGLIGIIQLHPYEYVYFNSLAGGVEGAFREYELDYWLLSNLEAIEFLNENAAPNVKVSFYNGHDLISWFAREDFKIAAGMYSLTQKDVNYLVVTTNNNRDIEYESYFPQMREVFRVERLGVPLAKVYQFPEP